MTDSPTPFALSGFKCTSAVTSALDCSNAIVEMTQALEAAGVTHFRGLGSQMGDEIAAANPLSTSAFHLFRNPLTSVSPGAEPTSEQRELQREKNSAAYLDFRARSILYFLREQGSIGWDLFNAENVKALFNAVEKYRYDMTSFLKYGSSARELLCLFKLSESDVKYEVECIISSNRRKFKRSEYFKKVSAFNVVQSHDREDRKFEVYDVLQGGEELPNGYSLFLRREIEDKQSDYRLFIDNSNRRSPDSYETEGFDGTQLMFGYGNSMADMATYLNGSRGPILKEFNRGFDNAVETYIKKVEQTGRKEESLAFMAKVVMYDSAELLKAANKAGLPSGPLTYSVTPRRESWGKHQIVVDGGEGTKIATGLRYEDAVSVGKLLDTKSDSSSSITSDSRVLLELQVKLAKLTLQIADEVKVQHLCVRKLKGLGVEASVLPVNSPGVHLGALLQTALNEIAA